MVYISLKLLIIAAILGIAAYVSYWVWITPIDFKRSAISAYEEKIKNPAQQFLDKPLGETFKVREPNKIYSIHGIEIGTLTGNVYEEENDIFLFEKISNLPTTNAIGEEIEWQDQRFKFISLVSQTEFEFPSMDKNVVEKVRFKRINNSK